jgi:hypothetical protein
VHSLVSKKALDGLAWGTFIILIGIGWWAGDYYQMDTGPYLALGVGLILIGLNAVRAGTGIAVSKFSLFIGIVALAIGGAGILGYSLNLFATILILIGLFVIVSAVQNLTRK